MGSVAEAGIPRVDYELFQRQVATLERSDQVPELAPAVNAHRYVLEVALRGAIHIEQRAGSPLAGLLLGAPVKVAPAVPVQGAPASRADMRGGEPMVAVA